MSAKDKVHEHVVRALRKDGWTITHDPLKVPWKKRDLKIDLGAEQLIAAEKEMELIAVEIKSFIGASDLSDLYQAIGQFILYRKALRPHHPDRTLYLAIPAEAYTELFADAEGEALRQEEEIKLLVFDKQTEEIILWKR
jgi:hypothetical protein